MTGAGALDDDRAAARTRLAARYDSGTVPWDLPLPPPEVVDLAVTLPPGRALDIGCGYGRAAIHLAERGWRVDALDFVPQAVAEARARVAAAGLAARVRVIEAAVPDLDELTGPYDLALDVGCAHSFATPDLAAYRAQLARLVRPGGLFALFCRDRPPGVPLDPESRPPGLVEDEVVAAFSDGFRLARLEHGVSNSGTWPDWPSAWFWWERTG